MTRFISLDLHSDNFTAGYLSEKGSDFETKKFSLDTASLEKFKKTLTKEDYIIVEISTNTFWFYDQVKELVKECFVVEAGKITEIYKTNFKTDKKDAEKLARRLRIAVLSGDPKKELPLVYVPTPEQRELRSLISSYYDLKMQIVRNKNIIHSLLNMNGKKIKNDSVTNKNMKEKIMTSDIPENTKLQIDIYYELIDELEKRIKKLEEKIKTEGLKIFENEVRILVSIKGISVFSAIVIMTDILDISRFEKAKNLCSYLRTAPGIDASNQTIKIKHINKHSRKLSLSLMLQSITHFRNADEKFENFYQRKIKGNKYGRTRVAICRKIVVAIFYMLKKKELFYYVDKNNYAKKLNEINRYIENIYS